VWAKLFKDVEKPSQQIRMLKQILEELGMTGRLSLEKAKAIKEKRELAQELGWCLIILYGIIMLTTIPEDVQAFAAAATKSKTAKPSESEEDGEEEEEEEKPAKRKVCSSNSMCRGGLIYSRQMLIAVSWLFLKTRVTKIEH
jgi:hypothetical protein